jgi:hypothetical protein
VGNRRLTFDGQASEVAAAASGFDLQAGTGDQQLAHGLPSVRNP